MSGSAGGSESYREKLEYFKNIERVNKGPKWLKEGGQWFQDKDADRNQDNRSYKPASPPKLTPPFQTVQSQTPVATCPPAPTATPQSPSDTEVDEMEIAPGTVSKTKALLRAMGVGQTYLIPQENQNLKKITQSRNTDTLQSAPVASSKKSSDWKSKFKR